MSSLVHGIASIWNRLIYRRINRDSISKVLANTNNYRLFSFDLYDTLLVRTTISPAGIFDKALRRALESGVKLPPHISPCYYRSQRSQAESRAREKTTKEEITLSDIQEELAYITHLPSTLCRVLIEFEVFEEMRSVRCIAKVRDLLMQLKLNGHQICLISDMYLPHETIRNILSNVGLDQDAKSLYVSSSIGLTKRAGSIYHYIMSSENVQPQSWIHIGDNYHSDYRVPRKLGISAYRYDGSSLNRYELSLARSQLFSAEALAGAMRAVRLSIPEEVSHAGIRTAVGATVAAPILITYVCWLLNHARSNNIQRLYFLSRDGQILFNLAQQILERLKWSIEIRYLYASRQAWFLPATYQVTPAVSEWILSPDPFLTPRNVASRLQLNEEYVTSQFGKLFCRLIEPDTALNLSEIAQIRQALLNGFLSDAIQCQAAKSRETTLGYLRQEGLLENINWALVDIGWHGRLQQSLHQILNPVNDNQPISGYYFGLRRDLTSLSSYPNLFHSYYRIPDAPLPDWRFPVLMEVFTAADHGSTIGYRQRPGGEYSPVLISDSNTAAMEWGLTDMRKGIFEVLEILDNHDLHNILNEAESLRPVITDIIKALMISPSIEEAESLGEYRFSIDQNEQQTQTLAPPLDLKKALQWLMTQDSGRKMSLSLWIEASCIRSGFLSRLLLSSPLSRVVGKIQKMASFLRIR